jgi:hypothetical protein
MSPRSPASYHAKATDQGPTFRRVVNNKTSTLHWGSCGLGGEELARLAGLIAPVVAQLHALHKAHALPGWSVLTHEGHQGTWHYCPNAIADDAERLILAAHADYRAEMARTDDDGESLCNFAP